MSPRTVTTYEIPSKSWCRVCPETRNIFYDDISFKSGARVISALSCEACPEPKHLRGSLSISWGCEVARPQCMSANPKPQTRPYPLAAECWFCLKKVFPKPPFLQGQIVNEAINSLSKRTSCERTPTTSLGFFTHFPSGKPWWNAWSRGDLWISLSDSSSNDSDDHRLWRFCKERIKTCPLVAMPPGWKFLGMEARGHDLSQSTQLSQLYRVDWKYHKACMVSVLVDERIAANLQYVLQNFDSRHGPLPWLQRVYSTFDSTYIKPSYRNVKRK